ncbi:MAG TPA: chemotaxis protein CheB [Fibrobacteria bacterium]|nr:chemotaxis protein CheB [Fibrobacteria bacterium]
MAKKKIPGKKALTGKSARGSGRNSEENRPTTVKPEAEPAARTRRPIGVSVPETLPIAAIGASAGGLDAFRRLLGALPADAKLSFVIIQHLSPNHESILPEILTKFTSLPVQEVRNGMALAGGAIYVMPPNCTMTLEQNRLRLQERAGSARHMPVDVFFRSMSLDQPQRAIAIILSGAGADGTLGLQEVKAVGGITFAQDDKSAKFDAMPRSAIASGAVDFVLSPEEIAAELARICRQTHRKTYPGETEAPSDDSHIDSIFTLLRRNSGVDFTQYKQTTIKRRIMRRMLLQRIESIPEYVDRLRKNPGEVQALYQDILIKVTSFFRDPESFEALKRSVFPEILKERPVEATVRIWVPGCATGEEVYSLAISLLECVGDMAVNTPIQIFATDISDEALAKARSGLYVENISLDVAPERLRRFFVRVDNRYQISKQIRDMCVFARHDITQDHPFSRIDLISCRNLLIYLDLPLQKKVIPIFHYALKPDGHLMLGTSETVGSFTDLFTLADKKDKIYRKKAAFQRFHLPMGVSFPLPDRIEPAKRTAEQAWSGAEVQKEADRLVLSSFAPPGVVVNADMDIIQFRGQTGPFLEPAPGQASLNFLKMLLPPLLLNARKTLDKVRKSRSAARSEGIPFKHEGKARCVEIEAVPLPSSSNNLDAYFLVLFREQPAPADSSAPASQKGLRKEESRAAKLRGELEAAKEYLQTIIEEQEATNEELKSANEEILSSNEELQSINEELETAKEELQSTNEELTTLNEELQNRNLELNQVNNDMTNLLGSVNVPIVMLGNDLRIRRFTPMAEKVLKLIAADVGRPFGDIKTFSSLSNVEQDILEVIDSVSVREMEVRDDKGCWYSLRIRPYRTSENKIDGAVLVFIDIDTLKTGMGLLQEAHTYAESIVQTVRHPMVVLEREGVIKTANRAYQETFGQAHIEVVGRSIQDLGYGKTPIPGLRELLADEGVWNRTVRDREVEIGSGETRCTLMLNSGIVRSESEKFRYLLLSMEDITARKRSENEVLRLNGELESRIRDLTGTNSRLEEEVGERQQAEENLLASVAELESFSYSVSHDLRAPLRAMQGVAEALQEDYRDRLDEIGRDYTQRIVAAAHRMDTLILDLLNYSRLGKAESDPQMLSLDQVAASVLAQLEKEIRDGGAAVDVRSPLGEVRSNRTLVEKALLNLVSNGIKFNVPGSSPRVTIRPEKRDGALRLWVEDNGIGIDPEHHDRIFRLFERLNGMERYPGTGIGLAIVRKSIESLGGRVGVESQPGKGSRFWFELPGESP